MEKEKLIQVLLEQNRFIQKVGIFREEYLSVIQKRMKMQETLALVGVRRCGKSTLAQQFLVRSGVSKEEYLYINLEDPFFSGNLTLNLLDELYNAYSEFTGVKLKYLVLDEIQNISHWEKWVRLKQEGGLKIIVTGSSSKLLASEFSTVLSGRSTSLRIYPLSFKELLLFECLNFQDKRELLLQKNKIKSLLRRYLESGGFPRVVLETSENKKVLLREYYESIVLRDVATRYAIREINLLQSLGVLLLTNISSLVSIGKLASVLQESFKYRMSLDTVSRFLSYFESAYLFFLVPIFSYKIKEQMQYPRKLYSIDLGLRNVVSFRFLEDLGKLAENLVFLELMRREKEIYYWKSPHDKEVDFVLKEGLKVKQLINVSWNVDDVKTKERERTSLLEAMGEFKLKEGLVITEDYEAIEEQNQTKIKYIPLWKWLLE
jgi:predicted AAA+ superfamily ATPase